MQDRKIVNKIVNRMLVYAALFTVLASIPMTGHAMKKAFSGPAKSPDEGAKLGKRKREEKGKEKEKEEDGRKEQPDQKRVKEDETSEKLSDFLQRLPKAYPFLEEAQVDASQKMEIAGFLASFCPKKAKELYHQLYGKNPWEVSWTDNEVGFCKKYYERHPSQFTKIPKLRIDASKLYKLVPCSHLVWKLKIKNADDRCLGLLNQFTRLIYLSLSTDDTATDSKFTDAGLEYLPSGLKELDLYGCRKITDASINHILQSTETLEALNLSWTKISDDGISHLLQNCVNLEKLRLEGCSNITGSSFAHLSGGVLKLGLHQTEVNDEALEHIANRCPNLIDLDLGSKGISGYGLKQVLARCKNLKELKLEDTQTVLTAFEALEEPHPALIKLGIEDNASDSDFQRIATKCINPIEKIDE